MSRQMGMDGMELPAQILYELSEFASDICN
jgi:hypothetical protein